MEKPLTALLRERSHPGGHTRSLPQRLLLPNSARLLWIPFPNQPRLVLPDASLHCSVLTRISLRGFSQNPPPQPALPDHRPPSGRAPLVRSARCLSSPPGCARPSPTCSRLWAPLSFLGQGLSSVPPPPPAKLACSSPCIVRPAVLYKCHDQLFLQQFQLQAGRGGDWQSTETRLRETTPHRL